MEDAQKYLDFLNKEYFKLHKQYEDLFWTSYMGDHSVDNKKDKALAERDKFRANPKHSEKVRNLIKEANPEIKKRLKLWMDFFERYQTPKKAFAIKEKMDILESEVNKKRSERKEGYIDPYTKKFVTASMVKMRTIVITHNDEKIRKACFDAREKMATDLIEEYIKLVGLRNQYARMFSYDDFYDFKVQREDGMTKKELFSIFDSIYEKTKYAKKDILELEKKMPGLRKPWNFGYMMAGDFTKEEDPYFQFDEALIRWGKSFAALGIDFKGGKLQLDLLDRVCKYNNGFCHYPELVKFEKEKRLPGSSNFTCNVVFGQMGSGDQGFNTLFHEGGHAAHMLNSQQKDVCVNNEYAPMSGSLAEAQSMFLDTLFNSVEWSARYAKNSEGESYPFDLFERKQRKLHILRPLGLNSIMAISVFEKEIYETKSLDRKKVIAIAKRNFRKYFERSEDSLMFLDVPHIYSGDNSGGYHWYGLAILALHQWREYFYNKYGYIVDNPNIGTEMCNIWELGATKSFNEFVVLATGEKLKADAYLKNATASLPEILNTAKERIKNLDKAKPHIKKIDLNAKISMVHGKKKIADNSKSFEDMAEKYKKWLKTQTVISK